MSPNEAFEALLAQGLWDSKTDAILMTLGDDEYEDVVMKAYRHAKKTESADAWSVYGGLMAFAAFFAPDADEAEELAAEADNGLERALAIDPRHWEAQLTRAVLYLQSDEPTDIVQSVDSLERLLEQQRSAPREGKLAKTYLYLGDAYAKLDRKGDAIVIWEKGADRYPDDTELETRLRR